MEIAPNELTKAKIFSVLNSDLGLEIMCMEPNSKKFHNDQIINVIKGINRTTLCL